MSFHDFLPVISGVLIAISIANHFEWSSIQTGLFAAGLCSALIYLGIPQC